MTVEMGKVNEKINHIEELMTNFIAQIAAKSLNHRLNKLRFDW